MLEVIDKFDNEFRFLSNFYPCEILFEGIGYRSVEHAYQAAKTLDSEQRRSIAMQPHPALAKKAGRTLVVRDDWDECKIGIMEHLLRQKFAHPDLKEMLLATDGFELIEGNT